MARFGFLSTYPPTRCGLATFTHALATAMIDDPHAVRAPGMPAPHEAVVVRVDDLVPAGPAAGSAGLRIVGDLHPADPRGRVDAAVALNACDVVIVQHEFGIYGGVDGEEILDVLARIERPVIVVMHTVLATPTPHEREVTIAVTRRAEAVVAMTKRGATLLLEEYGVPAARLSVIPHGAEPWPTSAGVRPAHRPVVLTWGLIGPGKGIEWGIRAMGLLGDASPAPIYRVLGQTHPKVVIDQGERYRESLVALVNELGLGDAVQIDGRYRELDELGAEVDAADVVLLPYDSREQTTSGVLSEAAAAGKFVVATAFPHAVELLAGGGGVLVEHENPQRIAEALRTVLADPEHARLAAERARDRASASSWRTVAARYRALADSLIPAVLAVA